MPKKTIRFFGGVAVLTLLVGGVAHAGTKKVTSTVSGSGASIPIDVDSDSCFVIPNGATVCTDYSASSTLTGQSSPGGRFTGQNLFEYDPVSGSGCSIVGVGPVPIASCTLAGSSEQGCAFESVGGAEVD